MMYQGRCIPSNPEACSSSSGGSAQVWASFDNIADVNSCTPPSIFRSEYSTKRANSVERKTWPPSEEEEGARKVHTTDGTKFALTGSEVDRVDVHAARELKDSQLREIHNWIAYLKTSDDAAILSSRPQEDAGAGYIRCPFCPLYRFSVNGRMRLYWKDYLLRHLAMKHERQSKKQPSVKNPRRQQVRVRVGGKRHGLASHTCSGFKQLQVLRCLFNADRLIRKCSDTYLEESATVMRTHLGKIRGDVDKATIKVLARNEVRFESRADPGRNLLRVGNVSVTKGFAELVFSEFLLSSLRMKTTRHRLVVHFLRAGCRIAELLPVEADFWVVLLEKILYSTAIRQRVGALIDECWRHGEFAHVSMDGLFRVTRRLRGQADYRQSKTQRDAAPINDAGALRRVLSLRGRTGAVVMLCAAKDESGEEFAKQLFEHVPANCLDQVRTLAVDRASPLLFLLLRRTVMPNLSFVALDPVHLCIMFEHAHGRKKVTKAAPYLHRIQAKLNRHFEGRPPFLATTTRPVIFSQKVVRMRQALKTASMRQLTAKTRLAALDASLP